MAFLIDTNVISEVRKGPRCDANVSRWYAALSDADLYLSVLVLGEIRKGAELLRARDPRRATAVDRWLDDVRAAFRGRVLPVDEAVAVEWGRLGALRPTPVTDGLMAATAKVSDLTLATRNVADVAHCGVRLVNPFEPPRRTK